MMELSTTILQVTPDALIETKKLLEGWKIITANRFGKLINSIKADLNNISQPKDSKQLYIVQLKYLKDAVAEIFAAKGFRESDAATLVYSLDKNLPNRNWHVRHYVKLETKYNNNHISVIEKGMVSLGRIAQVLGHGMFVDYFGDKGDYLITVITTDENDVATGYVQYSSLVNFLEEHWVSFVSALFKVDYNDFDLDHNLIADLLCLINVMDSIPVTKLSLLNYDGIISSYVKFIIQTHPADRDFISAFLINNWTNPKKERHMGYTPDSSNESDHKLTRQTRNTGEPIPWDKRVDMGELLIALNKDLDVVESITQKGVKLSVIEMRRLSASLQTLTDTLNSEMRKYLQ